MNPRVSAVVVAAGRGRRMGLEGNKVLAPLAGRPVLAWSLALLQACPQVAEIVIAAAPDEVDICRDLAAAYPAVRQVVAGGADRQQSVAHALAAVDAGCNLVLIHDGARPLLTGADLARVIAAAGPGHGAILAVPVKATIKQVAEDGRILSTPPRSSLWEAQTPQVFPTEPLLAAYAQASREGWRSTDDASLLEQWGLAVQVVKGSYENVKLTTPEDWPLALEILKQRAGEKEE